MAELMNWMTLLQSQVTKIYSLCQLGPGSREGYRMLGVDQLLGCFPPDLLAKAHDAILMAFTTTSSRMVLIANLRRYDITAGTIDEQPFRTEYDPSSPAAQSSGAWIQHGSWNNRTVLMAPSILFALVASGTARGMPLATDPPSSAGTLAELTGTSHQGAFGAVIRQLP